jgi:hypothetical protein
MISCHVLTAMVTARPATPPLGAERAVPPQPLVRMGPAVPHDKTGTQAW